MEHPAAHDAESAPEEGRAPAAVPEDAEAPKAPSEAEAAEAPSEAEAPEAPSRVEGSETLSPAEGAPRKKKPLPPVPPDRLVGAVEAMLFAAGDVLSAERLRDLLGLPSVVHVREAVETLRAGWQEAERAVEIQDVAGGYRVVTRPEYAEYVRRLSRRAAADRLSPSLLETLSIVAYRQPVPRVEVERIRGVQGGDALRGLLERQLVKVVGRSDQPGRPLLYGTTRRFLEVFGLGSLKDLPKKGDLKNL